MSCSNNTKPIDSSSKTIVLTTTPQNLVTMTAAAIPPTATLAVIAFNLAPAGKTDPLGRFTRDINFALSATKGTPIIQGKKVTLTKEQFGALFRSTVDTIEAFVEFFEPEP